MAAPPDNDVLWARSLHHAHDGAPALRDVSLSVRDGEIVAVTGARGSGKTTLLDCLSGHLPPSGGEVWFDGLPLHTLPPAERQRLRRERFGWIPDTPRLIPELTGWENAALPLLLAGTGARRARRTALEWLERVDAGDCARLRPREMPRPRQQRVAIARALVHRPALLFADEPTAPLHGNDRVRALRTLLTAARSDGITTLLTGCPQDVTDSCDRTLTLRDGRLGSRPRTAPGTTDDAACSLSV